MIRNPEGRIAMAYNQPIPKLVTVSGEDYICMVQYGVALIWAKPEHAAGILSVTKDCCGGGHPKPAFHYVGEMELQVWTTGHY